MKYFMMSNRFDKKSYTDFNLHKINDKYYDQINCEWVPCKLYDFGWGRENGFYKAPLGDFSRLISIVLDKSDKEDSYAAASIINDMYALELKAYLLDLINNYDKSVDYKSLKNIFNLDIPLNRTLKNNMDLRLIENEYNDWKNISDFFKRIK